MLFNSQAFLLFLASVLLVVSLIKGERAKLPVLLVASYAFYAAWDYRFLGLVIISTLVDYCAARGIESSPSQRRKKLLVGLSVAANLGILGFFKYYNFGVEALRDLLALVGWQANLTTLRIILPIGISFYTFQTIGYTIDVYRGRTAACRNLPDFALYVAFFPQLIAGPIERSTSLLPQIQNPRKVSRDDWKIGVLFILTGYFKKVVIADTLSPMVDHVFQDVGRLDGSISAVGVWAFAIQVYGDFAGYTLIARGVARLLGFELVRNFEFPYLAKGPRDFWRRWHISLSTWFRDYVYISLGGNRGGRAKTYRNLLLTMCLCGLWHGAAWTYVMFGLYHGVLLIMSHAISGRLRRPDIEEFRGTPKALVSDSLRAVGTFVLVLLGLLVLRADSLEHAAAIIVNIWSNTSASPDLGVYVAPTAGAHALLLVYHLWQKRRRDELVLLRGNPWLRRGAYLFMVLCLGVVGWRENPFFYFQF